MTDAMFIWTFARTQMDKRQQKLAKVVVDVNK